jgi:hypothetical protein
MQSCAAPWGIEAEKEEMLPRHGSTNDGFVGRIQRGKPQAVSRWQDKWHRASDELNGGVDNRKPLLNRRCDELNGGCSMVLATKWWRRLTVRLVTKTTDVGRKAKPG